MSREYACDVKAMTQLVKGFKNITEGVTIPQIADKVSADEREVAAVRQAVGLGGTHGRVSIHRLISWIRWLGYDVEIVVRA